jgi:hypothetical protein
MAAIMGVNSRGQIVCWILAGVISLALAGCVPADDSGPTATQIVFPSPTASPRPPSPTVAPTATVAPIATEAPTATGVVTAAALPSATLTPSASPLPPTETEVRATVTEAATEAVTATSSPQPTAGDFSPQQNAIWNTSIVGGDTTEGTCAGSVTPAYGPVQITPQENTLIWKSQEPPPTYTFSKQSTNVWQYSGPTAINDGTVTMTLSFTSANTFNLTRVFVATADPNCTHTHRLAGTFDHFR